MTPTLVGSLRLLLAFQVPQAGVEGTVRDERTGAPIPDAVVALPDLGRVALTDASGRYLLAAVPAGPQHLAVRFLGYAPRTLHAIVPTGGRLAIDVALRPEPLRLRTIEVRPPLAVRGLEPERVAFPDRAYSMAAIRNHPLLAEPDALEGLGGGEVALEPESPSGVHVRGAGSDQVAYLLDGIPVFSPYHSAGIFTGWNPDALAAVALSSVAPRADAPPSLAGVIEAETRPPGSQAGARGSVGTTQARITLDGPVGLAGAGYLLSLRSGFPGYPAPDQDPSYLSSESGDWLAKVAAPVMGGGLRLLAYENENEIGAAAGLARVGESPRHRFEWGGRSIGLDWRRETARNGIRIAAWSARTAANAAWRAASDPLDLRARRHDRGALVGLARTDGTTRSEIGVRVERRTTSYAATDSAGTWSLAGNAPEVAVFLGHRRPLRRGLTLDAAATLGTGGGLHVLPRAVVAWRPAAAWTLSAAAALLRQPEQSLRNPESVIGNVFPADLYIGSGAPGVPAARARQLVLAADYQPAAGLRFGAQAYLRRSRGLLLAAPRAGGPFAARGFVVGEGSASGVAVTAAARGSRIGATASYGLQRARLTSAGLTYVPTYGSTHLAEAGMIVFPSATFSIRLGATAASGRRTTTAAGGLEWEACNLRDRGCELAGSPDYTGQPLGGRRLPGYLRLDLGLRKHWHVRVAGRDAAVALYGTITNLVGRRNVLTYALDPATGAPAPVEMRPLSPLVVGLDWQY